LLDEPPAATVSGFISRMIRAFARSLAFVCSAFLATSVAGAAEELAIFPAEFELHGSAARQLIVVERKSGADFVGDISGEATLTAEPANIVKIENGVVVPLSDGETVLTARHDGKETTARVVVRGMKTPAPASFRNHVQPILAKAGCSLGACHGAAAGQGGFKLSLRGYDDEGDYLTITHAAVGRRITPADPARSLLLLKPTNAVPHKGGERFKPGSAEWQTIVEWIANGTPGPSPNDARIAGIEVLPPVVRLPEGGKQQVIVRAHFNDGRIEDVTRNAKFTATDQSVANVDDNGLITVVGHGESAVSAWFLSKIATGSVTAPFANALASSAFTEAPARNWIDQLVLDKLRSLNLPPSPRCSDHEFIRRAFLDTIGVLPTPAEVREFIADTSNDRRDRWIARLLERPEFVDYWTYKWSDLLLVTKRKLKPVAMWAYYKWVRDQVATNTPWDRFARNLLTAQGSTLENGAANYFVIHQDPRELAETTALTFLGFSMNCAKCHNHPMEKWTNDDYYGFANLFSRVRFKNGREDGENVIFATNEGELVQPLTGQPQPPRPLDGEALAFDAAGDRRIALVEWLTSRDNFYFKRSIVNRIWANFFGVGLVENVDDIRASNPASNEPLFSAAAEFLASHRFDLKLLMREILQSETYQRSSVPVPGNEADARFHSRYYPRRLMAEVLHDAIAQATGVPTVFKTRAVSEEGEKPLQFPAGWRAVQLPDANTDNYFTKAFGRPDRDLTCECERTAEPSVTQALHLSNGTTINEKLAAKDGFIAKLVAANRPVDEALDEMYLAAVARPPSAHERERLRAVIAAAGTDQRAALEDIFWALLSSREFLFNH
jgi:hypothetical protein